MGISEDEKEHEKRISFDELHAVDQYWYGQIKLYLSILGAWAYQSLWKRRLIIVTLNIPVFLYTLSGGVLNAVLHWDQGLNVVMSNILLCTLTSCFAGQYIICYLVSDRFPPLLTELAAVSRTITDSVERKILTDFAETGRRMKTILLGSFMLCPTSSFFFPLISMTMDAIEPLGNGTRRSLLLIPLEFVIFNAEDHYLFSSWLGTCSGTSNCMAGAFICCIYILLIKQMVGLFSIVSHRLDHIVGEKGDQTVPPTQIRKNFAAVVTLHAKTLRLANKLKDTYDLILLTFQILSVVMLSLSYFYVAKVRNVPFVRHYTVAFLIVGMYAILLCFNALGQEIIDVTGGVFDSAYSCEWYILHPKDRKYILSIMQRASYPVQLTAGSISILSYETFAGLCKASLSYFTMLKAIT